MMYVDIVKNKIGHCLMMYVDIVKKDSNIT